MHVRRIAVERIQLRSSNSFSETFKKLQGGVGHPDMPSFTRRLAAAGTKEQLEALVQGVVSPLGLMEFSTFDLGGVMRKELGERAPRSLRLLIGNPLIMKQLVERVPDAGAYAPVTILLDERPDGVYLSYDAMTSLLTPYGDAEALKVAQDLDAKIHALLSAATR